MQTLAPSLCITNESERLIKDDMGKFLAIRLVPLPKQACAITAA
jgi:hypothetical protein